jgi:hypothetical protein
MVTGTVGRLEAVDPDSGLRMAQLTLMEGPAPGGSGEATFHQIVFFGRALDILLGLNPRRGDRVTVPIAELTPLAYWRRVPGGRRLMAYIRSRAGRPELAGRAPEGAPPADEGVPPERRIARLAAKPGPEGSGPRERSEP